MTDRQPATVTDPHVETVTDPQTGTIHVAAPPATKDSLRDERFIASYVENLNTRQAAMDAGFAESSASGAGWRMLRRPYIQGRIQQLHAARLARHDISADRVLEEFARIAFNDPRGFFDEDDRCVPIRQLTHRQAAAVAGFEVKRVNHQIGDCPQCGLEGVSTLDEFIVKVKTWNKKAALDSLAKHLGVLGPDTQVNVNVAAMVTPDTLPVWLARLIVAVAQARELGGDAPELIPDSILNLLMREVEAFEARSAGAGQGEQRVVDVTPSGGQDVTPENRGDVAQNTKGGVASSARPVVAATRPRWDEEASEI